MISLYKKALGLHDEELTKRNYTIALLKHIAFYKMRADGYTFKEIADNFNMHHTSVMHAVKKIDDRIGSDEEVKILYKYYALRVKNLYKQYVASYDTNFGYQQRRKSYECKIR